MPNTIALEGLDANNNNAPDDESAMMSPVSNLNAGRIAIHIGIIKALVVELVITFARIIAKNPNMQSRRVLFNCNPISILA